MTTKWPLRKQVIIPMSKNNAKIIRSNTNFHIKSINRYLKETNSSTSADFIHMEKVGIIMTTNQAASVQDIGIINKILKEAENINWDLINSPQLLQSKLFLKILSLLYFSENTNHRITSELVKRVIKELHIFNDITLASKLWIIKVSSHSNSAVIWIDIWDLQNGSKAKTIINQWFNVSRYVATIHGINVNSGVLQYKNCWKWDHSTLSCWSHMSRYIKCYEPYNFKHHRKKTWYCKENNKLTPLRLATKEGKPCPHIFKCINCKKNHQADRNTCSYWQNHFNKEWYSRKQQELHVSEVQ